VKHKLFITAMLVALVVPAVALAGPMFFNVSPGQTLQGVQFGMAFGHFQPYIGLDMAGASGKVSATAEGETVELKASASVFIPNVGVKYAFKAKELKPYLFVGYLKSFGSISASADIAGETYDFEGNTKDQINDLLSFWGFNLGFGVEYPFSEHFGVGGEYGFRYLHAHSEGTTDENSIILPEDIATEINASLRATSARASLNYTF
jgi:hypothetical protein